MPARRAGWRSPGRQTEPEEGHGQEPDLERAFWGDPIGDFPTAFVFCDDIRKEENFLEAYLEKSDEIKKYTGMEERKFLLYRMYILTIMAAETFRYGLVYGNLQGAFARINLKKTLKELEKLEGR